LESSSTKKIELAIAEAADDEFLYSVYASTRSAEVALFGWDAAQIETFLRMQFSMRSRSYAMQFPTADTYVVLLNGTPVGSMIVERTDDGISLTDIAILPEYRGNGIATHLISTLQDEASGSAWPVNLTVDKGNVTAFRLYTALGFIVTSETDLQYSMQWNP
jgi:ribosomal protein S18 acetylase RimI-like enzyme